MTATATYEVLENTDKDLEETLRDEYLANLVPYENAIRIVEAFIKNTKAELLASPTIRNPIKSDESRLKTLSSAISKCRRKGVLNPDLTVAQIKQICDDIAGIRIICLYLDDIDKVLSIIKNVQNISIVEIKDYVSHPKESGYSSLHLKTSVMITTLTEGTRVVPVEIQIRTALMDAWAQAEWRAKYKSEKGPTEESNRALIELAKKFRADDELLVKIRQSSGED